MRYRPKVESDPTFLLRYRPKVESDPTFLHEHVVAPATLAVHADPDAVAAQDLDERGGGQLAALVGVHDVRHAVVGDRLFQRLDGGIRRQTDRQSPRQDSTAGPVEDHGQIHEAAAHRDVGRVHRPDLVRAVDGDAAQQIREHGMLAMPATGPRPLVERLDAHPAHQRGDMLAADRDAFAIEQVTQHPTAGERMLQVQFVDTPHQRQVRVRGRLRLVVDRRARQVQQLRLAHDRQRVRRVNHRFALASPMRPSAPAKKSFSKANCPILACSVFTSGPASRLSAAVANGLADHPLAPRSSDRNPGSSCSTTRVIAIVRGRASI